MKHILAGVLLGWLFPAATGFYIGPVVQIALYSTTFFAGIGIGAQKEAFLRLRRMGAGVLLVPLSVVAGSIAGGLLAGAIAHVPPSHSGAVAAGLAYYSVSVGILTELGGPALGALTFLANALRELLALAFVPLVAKHLPPLCVVSLGGATTMDTTLPVIARFSPEEIAAVAVVNGVILTILSPLLTPLLYHFL